MQEIIIDGKFQLTHNANTCWIADKQGFCIGRFDFRFGIDVHRSFCDDFTSNECLYCTHEKCSQKDFETFCLKMKEFYGIAVPANLFS